ncbi:hypothetical protein NDU88_007407 [Pleurodeles waltl]|uniref:Glycosyl transferase family 1 domain-containing protein n=1 Tax=Pleurodeles waltl TaxID=8319 RepID=A0AAV7LTQ0_PLEWA|nr:hypothetical protein NDU88_007407 [Pleurodeles waltl]
MQVPRGGLAPVSRQTLDSACFLRKQPLVIKGLSPILIQSRISSPEMLLGSGGTSAGWDGSCFGAADWCRCIFMFCFRLWYKNLTHCEDVVKACVLAFRVLPLRWLFTQCFVPDTGTGIPFGAVFGGTDINEDTKNEEKSRVMGAVLEEARFAVAFTCQMKEAAERQWPHCRSKIYIQPQGILTSPSPAFSYEDFLRTTEIPQRLEAVRLFVLVCGLRRVKDPLYLVDAFSEWHRREPRVYMVIIGPTVDALFTSEVEAKLSRAGGVQLLREMPQQDLQAVMKCCFAVVNSSISEGMSASILEAMDLGVPVLARNIPGNAAIISHQDTGLLFSDPQVSQCPPK